MKKIVLGIVLFFSSFLYGEVLHSAKAVIDTQAKLMWQDDEEVKVQEDITLAKVYCETLILNGYDDWYLPSIKQLQGIVDIENKKVALDKVFRFYQKKKYWSDTPYIEDDLLHWYVDFSTGKSNYMDQNEKNNIRCVRDMND